MKKKFLDSIDVKSPCNESWNEMFGNDEVRFCSHCAKDVHNISAMNRAEAEKLVKKSKGNICVRYTKTPEGKLITAPPKLTQITKRVTIAATVLATSLAFSTIAYAQGSPILPKEITTKTDKQQGEKGELNHDFSIISGTVADENGGLITRASITLFNTKTEEIRRIQTNDEGIYEFKGVEPNVYELQAESPGFKKLFLRNIEVLKDTKLVKNIVLEVSQATIGVVSIEGPIETQDAKISEEAVKQKPLIKIPVSELPINDRKFVTLMGLIPATVPAEKPKKKKN